MILFTKREFEEWRGVKRELTKRLNEIYREDMVAIERGEDPVEGREWKARNEADNELDRIEGAAHERTMRDMSDSRLYEDTQQAIYYDVYKRYSLARILQENHDASILENGLSPEEYGLQITPKPDGGAKDLHNRIWEQVDELRRRGDGEDSYYAQILPLWTRFQSGEIDIGEAECAKGYEQIRVMIDVEDAIAQETSRRAPKNKLVYPDTYVYPTDATTRAILSASQPLTHFPVTVAGAQPKKNIAEAISYVTTDFTQMEGVNFPRNKSFTPFDKAVLNAAISLYDARNACFTIDDLYKVLTGDSSARVQPEMRKAIAESMTLLARTWVDIEMSDEAQRYGYDKGRMSGTVLSLRGLTVERRGVQVNAYRINETPILFEYAQHKNQIGRVSVKRLKTPGRTSKETIALTDYLLQAIEYMKTGKRGRTISYETMFDRLGNFDGMTSKAQYNKRTKMYELVRSILSEWITQGYIKGFVENHAGGSRTQGVTGVTIQLIGDPEAE